MTKTTTQNGQLECCGLTWKSIASLRAHQRWHWRKGVPQVKDAEAIKRAEVLDSVEAALPGYTLAYCPCCGVHLDKIDLY